MWVTVIITVVVVAIIVAIIWDLIEASEKERKWVEKANKELADKAEAERLWKLDIPKTMMFEVPRESLVEYYKAYGLYTTGGSYDNIKTCTFWNKVREMVPELETDKTIVEWQKDVTHIVNMDVDHSCTTKPVIVVTFDKRKPKEGSI